MTNQLLNAGLNRGGLGSASCPPFGCEPASALIHQRTHQEEWHDFPCRRGLVAHLVFSYSRRPSAFGIRSGQHFPGLHEVKQCEEHNPQQIDKMPVGGTAFYLPHMALGQHRSTHSP
jgi:hypothetical protein